MVLFLVNLVLWEKSLMKDPINVIPVDVVQNPMSTKRTVSPVLQDYSPLRQDHVNPVPSLNSLPKKGLVNVISVALALKSMPTKPPVKYAQQVVTRITLETVNLVPLVRSLLKAVPFVFLVNVDNNPISTKQHVNSVLRVPSLRKVVNVKRVH